MNKKSIILISFILMALIFYCFKGKNEKEEYLNIYIEENVVTKEENKVQYIKIHIIGEIINPGIHEIREGSRINDAIQIAGGPTEIADLNKINLAYELSDGEKIYIPSIFDEEIEYNLDSGKSNKKININKASAEELQEINGIGASLANRIIEYRKENGRFSSIDDLKNVSGIGDKKYETIKEYIDIK